MKKILVTGLCLSRNLGGPAMAITFCQEMLRRNPEFEITFAVNSTNFELEKKWADFYKFRVIPYDNFFIWFSKTNFFMRKLVGMLKFFQGRSPLIYDKDLLSSSHKAFVKELQVTDVVVNLNGISYVGDGTRGGTEGLYSFSDFFYARKYNKPFFRFIQSFGPFNDLRVRFFAEKELKSLPFVFARGKKSQEFCRNILSQKSKILDFPDCAILLEKDDDWARLFLTKNRLKENQFVVISPSAVMRNIKKEAVGGCVGEKHVESFSGICAQLQKRGETLVFLPHMYSDAPTESDLSVSFEIANKLSGKNQIVFVDCDFNPMQAKALISKSKFAVVSRYHALVAALSTGTRVVAVGWNAKYEDLMEYYQLKRFVLDARDYQPNNLVEKVLNLIEEFSNGFCIERIKQNQSSAEKQVCLAFDLLVAAIKEESLIQKM